MDATLLDGLRGTAPMTQAKRDLIEGSADGLGGALRLWIAGTHGVVAPDLVRLEDVLAKLKDGLGGLLPPAQTGQVSAQRVIPELRRHGAVKLFGGESLRDKTNGGAMRLWCMRGQKVDEYEALGHQGAIDAYRVMRGDRGVQTGMPTVVPFKKP
jgi:hypothetical protein